MNRTPFRTASRLATLRAPRAAWATAALLAAAASGLRAGNVFYVGPNGGNWNNTANWSLTDHGAPPASVPVDGDNATIDPSAGSATVNFDGDYTGTGLFDLNLSGTGGATAKLSQSANTMTVSSEVQIADSAGSRGSYAISGGTLHVTASVSPAPLLVGWNGNGSLNVSNTASVNVEGNVNVGQNSGAVGTVTHSGGAVTVGLASNLGSSLFLGRFAGSSGSYTMSEGTGTSSLTVYGSLFAGYAGGGTFTHNAGTVTVVGTNNSLQIGATAGATGSYTMNGGTLSVQAGDIDVGGGVGGGVGTFTVNSGSSVSVGTSYVTRINCTSNINGGTVNVTRSTGVDGTLNVNGGTLNTPGQTNGEGLQVESTGTVNLAGGTINAGDVYLNGAIHNTGGTLNVSRNLFSPNGTGTYDQLGGNLTLANGSGLTNGTFTVTGGTVNGQAVTVGQTANSITGNATLALTGGVTTLGTLGVGNNGTLTGGSGSGSVNVSAGTLNAATVLLGSSAGGSGSMTISGTGAVVVGGGFSYNDVTLNGGSLTVLDQNPPPGEDPVLNRSIVGGYLRDGAMNVNAGVVTTPNIKLGVTSGNTGTYAQTGGTVTVGVLGVGNDATLTGGSGTGHATVSAGILNADTILLGNTSGAGGGDLTISGTGQVNVGGGFTTNDLTMNGGSLTVADQNPPPGEDPVLNRSIVGGYLHDGAMFMNNGTVTTPNMKVGIDHKGTYVQTGGTVSVTTQLIANQGANSVVTLNGGTMNLASADINTGSPLTVGDGTHSFLLNLSGGTVKAAQGILVSASGHLTGIGSITGDVSNNGTIDPADAPGTIGISGNLTSSGILNFDLASTSGYDRISLPTGLFTAGGTIGVSLINGYVPSFGATFKIMDFALLIDNGYAFDFSGAALRPGLSWDTSAFSTSGIINVVPEPGTLSLLTIGAGGLLMRRRKGQGIGN